MQKPQIKNSQEKINKNTMRERIKLLLLTSLPFVVLPSTIWFGVMAYIGKKPYHPLAVILFLWSPVIFVAFIVGLILTILNIIAINSYMRRYRPKNPIGGWVVMGLLCLFIIYSLVVLYLYVVRAYFLA